MCIRDRPRVVWRPALGAPERHDAAVQMDDVGAPGPLVQVVDILRDDPNRSTPRPLRQGDVAGIRLRGPDQPDPPEVPAPDQLGVGRPARRAGQRHRVEALPQSGPGAPEAVSYTHLDVYKRQELSVKVALAESRNDDDRADNLRLLEAVRRLHEANPMLGLRGVRLGLVIGGLFAMQARAILEATAERVKAGGDPRPEIMVPLVGAVQELESIKEEIVRVAKEVSVATGVDLQPMVCLLYTSRCV